MENNAQKINWYPGHMHKAKQQIKENLKLIDIVYELVDARIPISSKIKDIDEIIKSKPKILIMTKSDLCDKEETLKIKKYYESTGYKIILMDLKNDNTNELIKLTNEILAPLKLQREKKGIIKKTFRVLVIGIPNVGKSTLINKLVNRKAAKVGNQPGVTKILTWIKINNDLELLDTPGILWPKFQNDETACNLASMTAIKEELIPQYEISKHILNKLSTLYPSKLERYKIFEISENITETYDVIGKNTGCVLKNNEIDYDKVYGIIINDIKSGRIKNITFDRLENL